MTRTGIRAKTWWLGLGALASLASLGSPSDALAQRAAFWGEVGGCDGALLDEIEHTITVDPFADPRWVLDVRCDEHRAHTILRGTNGRAVATRAIDLDDVPVSMRARIIAIVVSETVERNAPRLRRETSATSARPASPTSRTRPASEAPSSTSTGGGTAPSTPPTGAPPDVRPADVAPTPPAPTPPAPTPTTPAPAPAPPTSPPPTPPTPTPPPAEPPRAATPPSPAPTPSAPTPSAPAPVTSTPTRPPRATPRSEPVALAVELDGAAPPVADLAPRASLGARLYVASPFALATVGLDVGIGPVRVGLSAHGSVLDDSVGQLRWAALLGALGLDLVDLRTRDVAVRFGVMGHLGWLGATGTPSTRQIDAAATHDLLADASLTTSLAVRLGDDVWLALDLAGGAAYGARYLVDGRERAILDGVFVDAALSLTVLP